MQFHVMLGSSGRLPDLWNMKLTFSSCEVGSYCWQSLVAGAGSHLCAVCGTREDLLRCKERGTTLPQGHWMWLPIPHLEIKLPDLPSDSFFIPGTRLKACCISPSPGEQYLGRATSLQSVITRPHGFFHTQCHWWM